MSVMALVMGSAEVFKCWLCWHTSLLVSTNTAMVWYTGSTKEEPKPSPAGAFNPYGVTDEHWLKGGKRSAVMPRSGNRSRTFAGQGS